MRAHLTFEQWVPFPLERVFEFFSNPENLPRIMPSGSATQLLTLNRVPSPGVHSEKVAGVGSTIATSFRLFPFLPVRGRWIARITEFEWNHYFADVQEKGPFKSWHHRHEFSSEIRNGAAGTLVRDVIDYDVGYGWLGSAVNSLLIRGQMERTFLERQQKLPDLLQG